MGKRNNYNKYTFKLESVNIFYILFSLDQYFEQWTITRVYSKVHINTHIRQWVHIFNVYTYRNVHIRNILFRFLLPVGSIILTKAKRQPL